MCPEGAGTAFCEPLASFFHRVDVSSLTTQAFHVKLLRLAEYISLRQAVTNVMTVDFIL